VQRVGVGCDRAQDVHGEGLETQIFVDEINGRLTVKSAALSPLTFNSH